MRQDASAVAAGSCRARFGLRVAADATPIPAVPGLRRREAALSPLVRRVIDHLESNYLAPGLLQDLARTLNKSRFQVIRSFRREMQITPHAYLIRLRIIPCDPSVAARRGHRAGGGGDRLLRSEPSDPALQALDRYHSRRLRADQDVALAS